MLRYSDNLRPDDNYASNKKLVYGTEDWIRGLIVIEVVLADYTLRESVQRADYIEEQSHALQKMEVIGNDKEKAQLQKLDEELRIIGRKICLHKRDLYEVEAKLMGCFGKLSYDLLRQDPEWYLRKELIEDCIDSGGCCGRQCGCCKNRHLNSKWKWGAGHCTAECGCCSSYRGSEYTEQEKKDIVDQLKRMLSREPPRYLIEMAMGYFAAPDVPKHVEETGLSESKSDDKKPQKAENTVIACSQATKEPKRKFLFKLF